MDKFDEKIKDRGASRYVFPQRKFDRVLNPPLKDVTLSILFKASLLKIDRYIAF